MLCFAFAVLCARLRQELGVAVRCYALLYAVLGYGKGYVWLCKAMLCYAKARAMLCYDVRCGRLRQVLGVAVRCYALLYDVLGYGKGYALLC